MDASFIVKERLVNFASIQDTRDRLHQLLVDNLGRDKCSDFPLDPGQAEPVGLLAQGSSACIWRADLSCSSAYQPGLSDYDIELVVGDGELDRAQQCAEALEAETELYGRTGPAWAVLVQLETHLSEHLGQSIAYARMNGVVPPWSR